VIGVIGRIHPVKGQDQLLKAAPLIKAAFPEVRFRFLGKVAEGDTEGENYLRQLTALAGQAGPASVEFRGWVDDVSSDRGQFAVLVVPSRREPFGRVIVEAFAARVPVVAAAVDGIPEVVEQGVTGLLCPPGDNGALGAAVLRLLQDEALRARLVEQAYQDYLLRWRLERYQKEMLGALRRVLSREAGV